MKWESGERQPGHLGKDNVIQEFHSHRNIFEIYITKESFGKDIQVLLRNII